MGISKFFHSVVILSTACWCITASAQPSDRFSTQGTVFQVGLFLPLNSKSIFLNTKDDFYFPEEAQIAVEYAQGLMLAFEELASKGMKAQLHIVDILDSTDFSRGLKQLSNAHLLFGMFHGKELKTINELSFSNHIPVVYALPTLTSPVSGNQYFILGSATLRSHCEYLFEYVYRRHFGDRVLLVGRKQVAQEMEVLSYFQSLNQKKTEAGLYPLPWIVFQDTGRLALRNLADSLSHLLTNVVILASNDAQFINSIMHHLSKHAEKSIKLIGMPGWRTLERISPSLLDSFDCLISTSFFYERTDSAVQHFRNNYQARFLVPPSEHALRGYDHGKYFGNQLAQFGRWMLGVFPPPASPPVASVFKVVPVMQGENVLYRENKGVFLLRYTQGKWQRFSGS